LGARARKCQCGAVRETSYTLKGGDRSRKNGARVSEKGIQRGSKKSLSKGTPCLEVGQRSKKLLSGGFGWKSLGLERIDKRRKVRSLKGKTSHKRGKIGKSEDHLIKEDQTGDEAEPNPRAQESPVAGKGGYRHHGKREEGERRKLGSRCDDDIYLRGFCTRMDCIQART